MSEDKTADTLHFPSFEERVLAQLDDVSSRLAALEGNVVRLEGKVVQIDYETKPNWERLHTDFAELHANVKTSFGNFDRKLDVINSELLQLKADQRELRVE